MGDDDVLPLWSIAEKVLASGGKSLQIRYQGYFKQGV